jgi:hypothetical protein
MSWNQRGAAIPLTVELAEKAHEDNRRPRQPTILHPLIERKLGKYE